MFKYFKLQLYSSSVVSKHSQFNACTVQPVLRYQSTTRCWSLTVITAKQQSMVRLALQLRAADEQAMQHELHALLATPHVFYATDHSAPALRLDTEMLQ